jgi:uncharacterized membrane protein
LKKFLKQSFMAGLLALLPIAGTIWLLRLIIFAAEDFSRSFIPRRFHPETFFGRDIPGMGLLVALILIMITGVLMRLYIGKKILSLGEKIFNKIPLGRSIYIALKQFLATIAGEGSRPFRRTVLVEFPEKGTYAIGFFTGPALGEVQAKTQEKMGHVFIPTTPNPTTGFLLIVPERKMIPLEMSAEEAFKLLVSGGVVTNQTAQSKLEIIKE